ncbi:hypothetical protein GCM10009765_02250 [Fodinicola feengrottensis]|uniref:OmpR/PhoB-type domain-containing protein n=1 Tax=Fodinicola feengrottensis TaxID=435914 RepID=A0ABN2FR59_9ACTN
MRAYAGDRELDLGPLKQRAVLAALLLNVNETVSVSRLVDTVWPDNPPHNGPNVVQKYVAGLRRVLEPDRAVRAPAQRLLRSDGGYVLRVDPGGLDAERFAQLQGESVNGDPTLSISKLRLALDLWRGEPLAGLAGPAFAHARIRLSESRAVAAETLAETELAAGRHRESTADLTRLVADFPLRERPRYLLMLALHRSGRPAEALAVFDDGQRLLTEEFGIDPGARLLELRAEILGARTAEIVPRPAVTAVAPAGRLGWTWVRKVLAGLIPLVTFGLASWAVVLSAAVARRSWRLGLLAALFLVQAAAVVVAAIENYEPPSPLVAAVLSGAYVASILWGAIAGLLLVRAPARLAGAASSRAIRLVAAAIPLFSFGLATWAVFGYYAIRRRSVGLALAAVGYYIPSAILLGAAVFDPDASVGSTLPTLVYFLVVGVGGMVHAHTLDPDRHQVSFLPADTSR